LVALENTAGVVEMLAWRRPFIEVALTNAGVLGGMTQQYVHPMDPSQFPAQCEGWAVLLLGPIKCLPIAHTLLILQQTLNSAHSTTNQANSTTKNGTTKAVRKRSQEGGEVDQGCTHRGQEAQEVAQGVVLGQFLGNNIP
jgi:hypothetical protein